MLVSQQAYAAATNGQQIELVIQRFMRYIGSWCSAVYAR